MKKLVNFSCLFGRHSWEKDGNPQVIGPGKVKQKYICTECGDTKFVEEDDEEARIPIESNEGYYCRWCGVDLEVGHSENCPIALTEREEEIFDQDYWSGKIEVGWGWRFDPIEEPIFVLHTRRVSNFTCVNIEREGVQVGPVPPDQKILDRLIKEHLKFWRKKLGEEAENYLEKQKKFFRNMSSDQVDDLFEAEKKLQEIYREK